MNNTEQANNFLNASEKEFHSGFSLETLKKFYKQDNLEPGAGWPSGPPGTDQCVPPKRNLALLPPVFGAQKICHRLLRYPDVLFLGQN